MVIVMASSTIFLVSVAHSWTRSRQEDLDTYQPSIGSVCSELAVLLWGTGFFLNGLDTPRNWGQIADLNLFGSSDPLSALLLWGALLVATLGLVESVVRYGRTSKRGPVVVSIWVTAILLLLLEGGTRVVAIIAPESQGYPTYTTALWSRKFVAFNKAGFRDEEHTGQYSDTPTLLVVGDSLAFGWGLNRIEDRFGEQLARQLNVRTSRTWNTLNASRGDTHTLTHLEYLKKMQVYRPDVTLLLYAFNDMDYLAQVTPRDGQSEHASTLWARISPTRILFQNSFLFQEVYVRLRVLTYKPPSQENDPYENEALLDQHFHDLARFVSLASTSSRIVAIVPFNIGVAVSPAVNSHYARFVQRAIAWGLPIWPAGQEAFAAHANENLVVNKLDSHPNELAHRLLAASIADRVEGAWEAQHQTMPYSGIDLAVPNAKGSFQGGNRCSPRNSSFSSCWMLWYSPSLS
jgi:lysophospholipase L1-like esterase